MFLKRKVDYVYVNQFDLKRIFILLDTKFFKKIEQTF